jgi:hypothetical protein
MPQGFMQRQNASAESAIYPAASGAPTKKMPVQYGDQNLLKKTFAVMLALSWLWR